MILYHGSSVEVKAPMLLKVQRQLDFGSGFYTTSDLEQAAKWAERTAKRRRVSDAFVSVYEFDENATSFLRILKFEKADADWLRFVSKNRTVPNIQHDWDIIIGPVANDNTMPVIDLYLDGMYTEEEAVRRLLPQKLKDQYVFATEKSIGLLRCIEVKKL